MSRSVRYETDDLTDWNRRNDVLRPAAVDDVLFSDLFRAYLPSGSLECIEVGAVPGKFLVWLHRELGYRITGIDFTDASTVFHETMALNGISEYEFVKANFLNYQPEKLFDVVCSFGFIEHFDDLEHVIQKHCDLVAPGGYLVLEVPNLRWLQYLYHWFFDRADLAIHNLDAMKPRALRRMVEQQGLETIHSGYHLKMMLWRRKLPLSRPARAFERAARRFAGSIGNRLPDTRFTSAAIFQVFRRPTGTVSPRES